MRPLLVLTEEEGRAAVALEGREKERHFERLPQARELQRDFLDGWPKERGRDRGTAVYKRKEKKKERPQMGGGPPL